MFLFKIPPPSNASFNANVNGKLKLTPGEGTRPKPLATDRSENRFRGYKVKTIWGLGKAEDSDIDGTGVKMVSLLLQHSR